MKKKICLFLTLCMTMVLSMGCAGVETETAQQTEQQADQQTVENFDSVCGDVAENIYTNDYFQLQYDPGDDYIFADDETISQMAQIAIESEAENSIYTEQLLKNNLAIVAMAVNEDETKNLVILVIKSSIGGKNIPTPAAISVLLEEETIKGLATKIASIEVANTVVATDLANYTSRMGSMMTLCFGGITSALAGNISGGDMDEEKN